MRVNGVTTRRTNVAASAINMAGIPFSPDSSLNSSGNNLYRPTRPFKGPSRKIDWRTGFMKGAFGMASPFWNAKSEWVVVTAQKREWNRQLIA